MKFGQAKVGDVFEAMAYDVMTRAFIGKRDIARVTKVGPNTVWLDPIPAGRSFTRESNQELNRGWSLKQNP